MSFSDICHNFIHQNPQNLFILNNLINDKEYLLVELFNTQTQEDFENITDPLVLALYYKYYDDNNMFYECLKKSVETEKNQEALNYLICQSIFYSNKKKQKNINKLKQKINKLSNEKDRLYFTGILYEKIEQRLLQ